MSLINSFYFICFFNSIVSFVLGTFVYLKNKTSSINKVWGLFCITIFLWSLGLGMMTKSGSYKEALFWLKYVHYVGIIFLPITFLHFCLILLEINKIRKKIIITSYIIGIIFLISNFLGYLVDIKSTDPFNYYTKPGLLYPVFLVIFFALFSYGYFEIFIGITKSKGLKKKQLLYFFISAIIGLSGGSSAYFLVYDIPIFPYGVYIFSFYTIVVSYAIVRYHLMDIYFIIKKSSLHTFMIAFTTIVYITVMFFFENMLHLFFKYTTIISRIIAGTIIALTFLPIYNKLKHFFDRFFFKERIEYLQSLNDFSQNLITILDLRVLMRSIVENINILINVKFVSLFSFDNISKIYKMESFAGNDKVENDLKNKIIYQNSPIVNWLKNSKEIEIKSKLIKGDTENQYIPVIVQMEELNAELVIPLFFDKKLTHILIIGEKNNQDIFTIEELNLLKSLANQASIAFTNATTYDKLKRLYFGTIEAFIKAIESKDTNSHGHSYRVVDIATKIGIEYGLKDEQIELIKYASVLHDVGRIGIPNNILNKPDKLTKKELDEMKMYPKIGSDIISSIEYFEDAAKIILHQHERWDGKGYPDNLKGEQIPLISRIIFVSDAFDALISNRSFRPALSKESAIEEIKNESGKQFDPSVVDCFISLYNKNLIN